MSNVDKLIQVAENEIGYLEKATNANLDDKTANAGSNNWTKYARDLDNFKTFYNGSKNGYAWCDVFVDWCFVKAFGVSVAKNMLCQPDYSAGAGCVYSANYYKASGRWYTTPKKGDQIFFTYDGGVGHTGIVIDVKGGIVYTIEGNTSGANGVIPNGGGVCKKQYPIGYSSIYGYGRPNYELSQNTVKNADSKETVANKERYKYKVNIPLCKYGDTKNNTCLAMQSILNAHGYNCGKPDGEFGKNTKDALISFQKANKLFADGECGGDTWDVLINGKKI